MNLIRLFEANLNIKLNTFYKNANLLQIGILNSQKFLWSPNHQWDRESIYEGKYTKTECSSTRRIKFGLNF